MKIGIITLPLHINYGGLLQAYALQTVLENLGHDVDVVEFEREKKTYIEHIQNGIGIIKQVIKSLINRIYKKKKVYIFLGKERKKLIPI